MSQRASGAFLPAGEIFNLAVAGTCAIEAAREDLHQENVLRAMKPRLFGLRRGRTTEEAELYVRQSCGYPSRIYGYEYEACEELSRLAAAVITCPNGDGLVYVSAIDYDILSRNARIWKTYAEKANNQELP
jgi:hypothetical protein